MTLCTEFKEDIKTEHYGRVALEGYIYHDVFEPHFFNTLKNCISSILLNGDTKTYLTHSTTFKIGTESKRILSHAQNAREQIVVYDITFLRDYYNQTNDTISKWADDTIRNNISSIFYKATSVVKNLKPFADNKDDWIFYRLHLNYLEQGKYLAYHLDSAPHLTNVKSSPYTTDHRDARMYSITFYLYDHKEGLGGEIWSPYGFTFKPKSNSLIIINGHQAVHGVTQNMDSSPRMAFTIRVAHKDDLLLPGHASKFLYNVEENLI